MSNIKFGWTSFFTSLAMFSAGIALYRWAWPKRPEPTNPPKSDLDPGVKINLDLLK